MTYQEFIEETLELVRKGLLRLDDDIKIMDQKGREVEVNKLYDASFGGGVYLDITTQEDQDE